MSLETQNIDNLLKQLESATSKLVDAKQNEMEARSHTAECLNTVNQLQKMIMAAYEKIRKMAPSGTDWSAQRKEVKA